MAGWMPLSTVSGSEGLFLGGSTAEFNSRLPGEVAHFFHAVGLAAGGEERTRAVEGDDHETKQGEEK